MGHIYWRILYCWLFVLVKECLGRVTFENAPGGVIVKSTREGLPINTTIVTLQATTTEEGATVYYRLQSGSYLDIDRFSGRIYNVVVLDAEAVDYINVIAEAYTDSSQKTTLRVLIEIEDINDNVPVFNQDHYIVNISEALSVGEFVTKVTAIDADDGGFNLEYGFMKEHPKFRINKVSGTVTTKESLNHEDVSQYLITVIASDGEKNNTAYLTINILDVDDLGPVFNQSQYNVSITEGLYQHDMFLIKVHAIDGDATVKNPISYSVDENTINGAVLNMNSSTGELFIRGDVDREVASYWEIIVKAKSTVHAPVSTIVFLHVEDVNEYQPYFSYPRYNGTVIENSAMGTIVMTLNAVDRDKNTLEYQIKNPTGLPFLINNNGEILVNGLIDREMRDWYLFKVIARESNTNEKYEIETSIFIQVEDVNDNKPTFVNESIELSVPENTSPPVILRQFIAVDEDILLNSQNIYSIVSVNGNEAAGFDIDRIKGVLTTTKAFDRENKKQYNFKVQATNINDDTKFSQISVLVKISDVNDNRPLFLQPDYKAEVFETVNHGAFVIQVKAEDSDAEDTLTYSLVGGSEGDFFIDHANGIVTTLKSLNRERIPHYNLTIRVSDENNQTDECIVRVKVVDINDNGPIFENETGYHFTVKEGEANSLVGFVKASDKDIGLAGVVQYELISSDFLINATTGAITTAHAFDREVRDEYLFIVKGKDLATDFRTSTVQVKVQVVDMNDNPPIFSGDKTYSTVVQTFVALQTTLFTFKANDKDIGDNANILYTSNDLPAFLSLNKSTGDLKVVDNVPEFATYLSVIVNAKNTQPPFQSDNAQLEIFFVFFKVDAPRFEESVYEVWVDENSPTNTKVIDLEASYENQPEGGNFTYSIRHGDLHLFSIHQDVGIISTLTRLDREANEKYALIVSVSLKGKKSSNFATININVKDKNDNAPTFPVNGIFTIHQKENKDLIPSPPKCSDKDVGKNAVIYYQITGSELIQIEEKSGELKLSRPLNYELDPHMINITVTCINLAAEPHLSSSLQVRIIVTDENDVAPIFEQSKYTFEFEENKNMEQQPRYSVRANDEDEGINGKVTYTIKSIAPPSNCFLIDSKTGDVSVPCRLDRENVSRYVIQVEARDNGFPSLSSTVEVVALVSDVNDQLPVFLKHHFSFSLFENEPPSDVGQLFVTDGDEGRPCRYCIIYSGNEEGFFGLTEDGTIHSKRSIDHETKNTYQLLVRAYMNQLGVASNGVHSNCTVTINIIDVNDNSPLFLIAEFITGIINTSPYGSIVTTLKAEDADASSKVSYTVTSGNEGKNFELESSSGVLTTAEDLEAKISSVFTLTVEATNNEEIQLNTTKEASVATIHVIVFDKDSLGKFSVSQNATYVKQHKEVLESFLSNKTSYHVTLHQIESEADSTRAIIYCYGVNVYAKTIISNDVLVNSLRNSSALNSFWNITPIDASSGAVTKANENTERQLLIGIILGVSVVVIGLIMLAAYLWLRGEQRKSKRPDETLNDDTGITGKNNGGFVSHGTRYYVEPYESSDMYGETVRNKSPENHLPTTFMNNDRSYINNGYVDLPLEIEGLSDKKNHANLNDITNSKSILRQEDLDNIKRKRQQTISNHDNAQNSSQSNINANLMMTTL